MLHSLKTLDGFVIHARDGTLGRVKDIYFDDRHWTVRYLEVDTGGWIGGRRVLVSPLSVIAVNWAEREVDVNLTRQQVHDSPGIDGAVPVARQHEADLFNYYGYPYYWTGPFVWGYTALPALDMLPAQQPAQEEDAGRNAEQRGDPHLRSKDEVVGYAIQAADDSFGHVDDFLIDERSWTIRLIVVDTTSWWPGGEVLVSPARVQSVSWEEKSVLLDVTRAQLESSPRYDPDQLAQEGGESDLYRREEPVIRSAPAAPESRPPSR